MNVNSCVAIVATITTLLSLSHRSSVADATPAPLRIVIIGDSTVCDYPATRPNRGWGQFIEERFKDGTVKSSTSPPRGAAPRHLSRKAAGRRRSRKNPIIVLIQFGHNDSHAPDQPEATDAATDYKEFLRRYVDESRAIGATPILVTPMVRRTFGADGKI